VYLASAHTTNDLPGGANVTTEASRTAVIEYSGVVVVAPDTQQLQAVEDGKVIVLRTCLKSQLKSSVLTWLFVALTRLASASQQSNNASFTVVSSFKLILMENRLKLSF